MTLEQKIGQMTQVDISAISTNQAIDPQKLAIQIGTYGVGSVINTFFTGGCSPQMPGGLTVQGFRALIQQIQSYALNQSQPNITPPIPVLYGLDSVHGANYVANGTLFPHNTGGAATFDPQGWYAQAMITTLDTRAAGPAWMFSPVLGVGMQPLWSRLYETPGEDPFVGAQFAEAYIRGTLDAAYQAGLNYTAIAACAKHYFGYSNPRSGKDRTDAWYPDVYLKQYAQPAFDAAISSGVPTVMINSGSVSGVPATSNAMILTDILRAEQGFQGVAVTDWQDIIKLTDYHAQAATPAEAIALAINAGVDMSMVPYDAALFAPILLSLVNNGTIPVARIDESVRRILQLKIDLGLFQDPVVPPQLVNRVPGAPADQAVSLNITRKSITLLQNAPATGTGGKPILPLTNWMKAGQRILVVGPAGDSLANLCGGWSLEWEGQTNCIFQAGVGQTIGQGVTAQASSRGIGVNVTQGVNFTDYSPSILDQVAALAAQVDVVVLAIGEAPESETPGSTNDLSMSPSQMALFAALNTTTTPMITVLVEPRPRVLGPIADGSAAIIMAYLPCLHGGQAIAEVLFGVTNPSGKLPITYPRTTGDLDVYYHKPWNGADEGSPNTLYHNPLFDFGTGLSYSTITYDQLALVPGTNVTAGQTVNVVVHVTNHGPYPAEESVLVFVRQLFRAAITPEARMLKAFQRVALPVGVTTQVVIPLHTADLAYWTPSLAKTIDAGVYNVTVGNAQGSLTSQLTISQGADVRVGKGKSVYGAGRSVDIVPHTATTGPQAASVSASASPSSVVDEVIAALRSMQARPSSPVAQDIWLEGVAQALRDRLEL